MTDRPEISVLINNYNYGRFLGQAIDSALDQDGVRNEVIVVDDGSSDNSVDVLEGYGDRVRAVIQPNGGQAAAMNAGVAVARAPLMAFLDADDWWMPGKLAAVVDAFRRSPDAGLVYHRLQPVHSDGTHAFAAIPRSLCAGDLGPLLLSSGGRWPFPMTSSLSLRRTLWDEAGDIPRQFRISADAWITGVLPFLTRVTALPEALGAYRIHQNTWYRSDVDAEALARRITHWEETVRVTNDVLAVRGLPGRLRIEDHFDHAEALARLGRQNAPGPVALALQSLGDPGEPNLLRRARRSLRQLAPRRRTTARSSVGAS
ncbi:glycosyltransferase family 2 protein [Pseudooceanicola sp. LIPI14-2-Ac024]|uniref:glycosyltransferase family 2 protein n=1 Tax=Pseudooceanicola sp. LIPI14-2-Ac024 TaxID=3344875 RepID=UPI0035CEF099